MIVPQQIEKNLWVFPIVLPNNPLKWLNCYVIKGERSLLIDTGFNMPECRSDLECGMEALGLSPDNTDIFLTHFHPDHIGNAALLEARGYRIIMGKTDYDYFCIDKNVRLKNVLIRMYHEGMPVAKLESIYEVKGPIRYDPDDFQAETVSDGDIISYGDYRLRCIQTPGHTPGHMCLYDEEKQLMFLGDHVLFDITLNICSCQEMEDSLGAYMKSLDMIGQYPIRLSLPSHRNRAEISLQQRAETLKAHHAARLDEALSVISAQSGMSAYEIAKQMHWKINAKNWDEFPELQQYFAMNEILAHLDNLVVTGRVKRFCSDKGFVFYSLNV